MSGFAFAPNGSRRTGETGLVIGGNGQESDNDALCYLRLCRQCQAPLTPKQHQTRNRFCSHACYSASLRLPDEPRFWSHVDKNGPIHPVLGTRCWLWTANVVGHANKHRPLNSRPGQFTYTRDGRQHHVYAHRYAWELKHGPIPPEKQVCHHCDVPPCVNDEHHFLGTQDDNMKDAARKNRFTVSRDRTLSLHDRLTIYQTPAYRGVCVELAQQYGVTKACISLIRSGRFLGSGVWSGTKQPGVDVHTTVTVRRTA